MRALFLLNTSDTADQYIAQESVKLLSIFSVAGGWIIGALILAAIFWKAGEERWKAYIPVYNIIVLFQIASMPGKLVLLLVASTAANTIGGFMKATSPPVALAFIIIAFITFVAYLILYLLAIYRIGQHLGHTGPGWAVLSFLVPLVALIIFAVDKSIWHDDEEIGWDTGKIGAVVPPARW